MLDLPVVGDLVEPLTVEVAGELDDVDMALMGTGAAVKAPPLQRLRARHHALAKALAEGMRPGIAAATFGYDPSRVSILQADPTFCELVEHYRASAEHDYAQMRSRLLGLSVEAIDEINRRLEEEPEKLTTPVLVKIAEFGSDRTGHGKKAETEVNINIGLADRLRQARQRALKDVTPPALDPGEIEDIGDAID